MERVTITRVSTSDTDKNGNKLINKFGKPYYKVGIKTNEYGDTFINGLMPFNPDRWEGTTQELEIFDEEYNGKTYKKFKLPPRQGGAAPAVFLEINRKLDHIITLLSKKDGVKAADLVADESKEPTSDGKPQPDFDVEAEWQAEMAKDVPF